MNTRTIILVFSVLIVCFGLRAESPDQVLNKTVSKIRNASDINCKFRIEGDGQKINGAFKSSGKKFILDTPAGKTWYDGESMYTTNPRTREVTVVRPTVQEVAEVNPFSYLNSYKSDYVMGFSKRKDGTRYLVVLNPKDVKKAGIKAVEVAVNKKTFLPERFIIRDTNDRITTVTVEALSLSKEGNKSETFAFPAASFKDYETVDLR